ncbi:MAG TPA: hypothetical protein VKE97_09335 [Acidimicrobiia bacterium]|nr:hypothetical protein [Acidimicrobiia bacterium]
MVGGRRYTFDEALSRRLKELEATLEDHHDAIAAEAQRWLADIERAAIDQLEVLEASAADKRAELQQVAADQRRALEQAAGSQRAGYDEGARHRLPTTASGTAPDRRIEDLREALDEQTALLEELQRLHAAASELENARAVTVDALRRSLDSLGRDVLAALRQTPAGDRVPTDVPPVHWNAPPDAPLS